MTNIEDMKARRQTGSAHDQLCNERRISDLLEVERDGLRAALEKCSPCSWCEDYGFCENDCKAVLQRRLALANTVGGAQ